jgi:hypothetical protein
VPPYIHQIVVLRFTQRVLPRFKQIVMPRFTGSLTNCLTQGMMPSAIDDWVHLFRSLAASFASSHAQLGGRAPLTWTVFASLTRASYFNDAHLAQSTLPLHTICSHPSTSPPTTLNVLTSHSHSLATASYEVTLVVSFSRVLAEWPACPCDQLGRELTTL